MAKYNCKTCGAELYFDPVSGKLLCEYCGSAFEPSEYAYEPEAEAHDETIPQPETTEGAAAVDEQSTDDSTGELVIYKCPHCGAEVITSKETAATTCVYCNRAITLEGNLAGDFRPDYVLPFTKTLDDVKKEYLKLAKKSVLTPRLFTKKSTVEKIKGMYVPFWLYTFEGDASIRVIGTNTRVWMTKDMEYTEISKYEIDESGHGAFRNIPADALKELDNNMMDSIEPFDFSKMKRFNPAFLAGFYTQRWNEDAAMNEKRAKLRAKESMTREVMKHVGTFNAGTVIKNENYTWSKDQVHYAMLPVWMMYTEYKGKKYIFGMNGQTGKMMGEIPSDPMRIIEIGGGVFIVSQIIMLIFRLLGVL
jgi:DNA-directed RNA polymerase subunit RPC12/RpoP